MLMCLSVVHVHFVGYISLVLCRLIRKYLILKRMRASWRLEYIISMPQKRSKKDLKVLEFKAMFGDVEIL